jgi:hypothetical protein
VFWERCRMPCEMATSVFSDGGRSLLDACFESFKDFLS